MKIPKGKTRKVPVKEHIRKVPKGTTTVKRHQREILQKTISDMRIKTSKLKKKDDKLVSSISNIGYAQTAYKAGNSSKAITDLDLAEIWLEDSSAYNLTFKKKYDKIKDNLSETMKLQKEIETLKTRDDIVKELQQLEQMQVDKANITVDKIKENKKMIRDKSSALLTVLDRDLEKLEIQAKAKIEKAEKQHFDPKTIRDKERLLIANERNKISSLIDHLGLVRGELSEKITIRNIALTTLDKKLDRASDKLRQVNHTLVKLDIWY